MSMAKYHKPGFDDILHNQHRPSDLRWSLRTYKPPQFRHHVPRSPSEVRDHVLSSSRVNHTIEQICSDEGRSRGEIEREAEAVLLEMGHEFGNVGAVRFFGYTLSKAWRQMYRAIYVNEDIIPKLKTLYETYPLVFMPSHRSYMDFLLMSYIAFYYDLPLPVITAGQDFMSMKIVGRLLRKSGAFFIRRSFGTDKLYWAIFTEYIQTHMRNGDAPIEFFVEGTRSRSLKSMTPKLGCLLAVLETYFKCEVPDMYIVPVSISYERVLEESLYAYELLGVPKPKESTSGLLRARHILQNDYGSIHVTFGTPVSIHDYFDRKVDRTVHGLEPRYLSTLTSKEMVAAQEFAYEVILLQQKNTILSPWSLICAVLLQTMNGVSLQTVGGVSLNQLLLDVQWLKQLAENLGSSVDWPVGKTAEWIIRDALTMHAETVTLTPDNMVLLNPLEKVKPSRSGLDPMTMSVAVRHMTLAIYRNQLMHSLLHVGLISVALNVSDVTSQTIEELYDQYSFLQNLLSKDFIFHPHKNRKMFDHALLSMRHLGAVMIEENVVIKPMPASRTSVFLSQLFEPFLCAYWLQCQFLIAQAHVDAFKIGELSTGAQRLGAGLLQQGLIKHHDILSLELQTNAVNGLIHCKAIQKKKNGNDDPFLLPHTESIQKIADRIGDFIKLPSYDSSVYLQLCSKTVEAKL